MEGDSVIENIESSIGLEGAKYSVVDPIILNLTVAASSDLFFNPEKGAVAINLGRSNIHVGPVQLFVLNTFSNFITTELEKHKNDIKPEIKNEICDTPAGEHFTDDLRLGIFTVEEDGLNVEIPLPYRVVYNNNSLTWTYPKARTLTKMVILPLPLTLAKEGNYAADSVACQLQFWSSNRSCWILYQHFQLQEGNVCHVDLPLCTDKRSCEFAGTWRIQMFSDGNIRDEIPCSLLSALRVDSYFSQAMLPDYQLVLHVQNLDLTLHNQLNYCGREMQGDLAGLSLSTECPIDQPFISFKVDALSSELSVWSGTTVDDSSIKAVCRGRVGIEYIDYSYLAKHSLLTPSDLCLKLQVQDNFVDIFMDIGRADFIIGPFSLHSLLQSAKLWDQVERHLSTVEPAQPFIPLTQILIENNTCQALLIGQAGTDEKICIDEKTLMMYAWRSHKVGGLLHIATGKHPTSWSKPIHLEVGETVVCVDDMKLVVEVVQTSTTIKTVKLSGLVTVVNLLQDHLELKLVHDHYDESKVLSGSYERPVSLLSKPGLKGLKVKLFGLCTPWSGEICLKTPRKFALLRLPQQDKGCSTTVWCNIIKEDAKLLVVLSPMYVLHSQLPGHLKTQIQCEAGKSDVVLPGFNYSRQLDIQQAPENKFSLSFQLNQSSSTSSPPVSVSWGIIDQVRSARPDKINLKQAMEEISKINLKKLKYSIEVDELSECKVVEESGTDCQVKFEEIHPLLNTLRIKVQPKLLIRNSTDVDIVLSCNDRAWYLGPNSLLHSPPAESFRFGILMQSGEEHFGPALEVTDHDWTYVSLLPNHDKIIPKFGNLIYQAKCGNQVLMMNIHSVVTEGMRIITLQPMFIFTNQLNQHLGVDPGISGRKSLMIQYTEKEKEEEEGSSVWTVQSGAQTQGLFWNLVDKGDGKPEFQMVLNIPGNKNSKLITIPTDTDTRQCFCLPVGDLSSLPCILISYRLQGQIHLVCLKDERPQFRLVNRISQDVYFREQSGKLCMLLKSGGSTFHTCSYIEESYPYTQEDHEKNRIIFGKASVDTGNFFLLCSLLY